MARDCAPEIKREQVSMEATTWRKVPSAEKDKLWKSIKSFFNVDDAFKPWVLKTAAKKWRAFKAALKKKHYDGTLTVKENIANGCLKRIPPNQWVSLVKYWSSHKAKVISANNKAARNNQENGTHTSGTRSFAVKQDQMEQREGRPVGRVELFFATHLTSEGVPVNQYAENKMREAKRLCDEDPSSIRTDDDELYDKLFPDAKKSRRHGMGLVVGGKTCEQIQHLVQLLKQSQDENCHLKAMLQTLATRSGQLEERMEERWSQFLATQKSQTNQQEVHHEEPEQNQVPAHTSYPNHDKQQVQQQEVEEQQGKAASQNQQHQVQKQVPAVQQGNTCVSQNQQQKVQEQMQAKQQGKTSFSQNQQQQVQKQMQAKQQRKTGVSRNPQQQVQGQMQAKQQGKTSFSQNQQQVQKQMQAKQQRKTGVSQNQQQQVQKQVPAVQQQSTSQKLRQKVQEQETAVQQQGTTQKLQKQVREQETLHDLAAAAEQIEKEKYKPCFTIYANTRNKRTPEALQTKDSQVDKHPRNKRTKREKEEAQQNGNIDSEMKDSQVEANNEQQYKQKKAKKAPNSQQSEAKMKAPSSQQSGAKMKAPSSQQSEAKIKAPSSQQTGANMKAPSSQQTGAKLHKVKLEKVAEQQSAARSNQKRASLKKGMEVGLTSPNSEQVVAYGTVQNTDKESKCLDGKPLCDYIEVLVNFVMKDTTVLPRAQGRITNLGSGTAQCIPWPRKNVEESDAESTVVQQNKEKHKRTSGKSKKLTGNAVGITGSSS